MTDSLPGKWSKNTTDSQNLQPQIRILGLTQAVDARRHASTHTHYVLQQWLGMQTKGGADDGRSGVWARGDLPSVRAQVSWSPGNTVSKLRGQPSEIVFALLTSEPGGRGELLGMGFPFESD